MTKAGRFAPSSVRFLQLGYHVEWKVLNSKDFGVPQARKRVYIVGYFDFRCAGKVLPEPETNGAALVQVRAGSQGKRVYSPKGLSCTLTSQAGGMGGKTGLYDVGVPIKENTKLGYKLAREGDSIDLGYANLNSRRGRVGHQIAHTLTTGVQQGTLHFVDLVTSAGGNGRMQKPEYQTMRCPQIQRRMFWCISRGWSKSSLNTSKRECSSERQTYERTRRTDVYNYCNRSSWHLVSRQNKKVSSEGMSATAGLLRLAD